jgi:hypothetical protein
MQYCGVARKVLDDKTEQGRFSPAQWDKGGGDPDDRVQHGASPLARRLGAVGVPAAHSRRLSGRSDARGGWRGASHSGAIRRREYMDVAIILLLVGLVLLATGHMIIR